MFTGIVETTGQVRSITPRSRRQSLVLEINAGKFSKRLKIGGSLAVDGVCLTVIKKSRMNLFFNVIRETKERSTLGLLRESGKVNLERPMKLDARLEGHIVLGHVDAVGLVCRVIRKGNEKDLLISFPQALKPYVLEKGSIAVNGVSLTLGKIEGARLWVHCIPHTLKSTNLGDLKKGEKVNIETDILAKLAAKQIKTRRSMARFRWPAKVH